MTKFHEGQEVEVCLRPAVPRKRWTKAVIIKLTDDGRYEVGGTNTFKRGKYDWKVKTYATQIREPKGTNNGTINKS
jgi:hypothetical protein